MTRPSRMTSGDEFLDLMLTQQERTNQLLDAILDRLTPHGGPVQPPETEVAEPAPPAQPDGAVAVREPAPRRQPPKTSARRGGKGR